MYTPRIINYFAIYLDPRRWNWIPHLEWNFGESTHFVHNWENDVAGSKRKPLNREWSLGLQFLFIYWTLTFEIPIQANWEDGDGE